MPEMTLIDAIREAMDEELASDPRVFVTGEDVGPRKVPAELLAVSVTVYVPAA